MISKLSAVYKKKMIQKFISNALGTAQKMNFSIKDSFSKCDQIRLRIWSHLLKESLMENFIFCAVGIIVFMKVFATFSSILLAGLLVI